MKKARLNESDFDTILHMLLKKVCLVPFEDFEPEYLRALHVMEPVDVDDTSFLAVGLALHLDGIWTEDRHFLRQNLIKVFHTSDLIQLV